MKFIIIIKRLVILHFIYPLISLIQPTVVNQINPYNPLPIRTL